MRIVMRGPQDLIQAKGSFRQLPIPRIDRKPMRLGFEARCNGA